MIKRIQAIDSQIGTIVKKLDDLKRETGSEISELREMMKKDGKKQTIGVCVCTVAIAVLIIILNLLGK